MNTQSSNNPLKNIKKHKKTLSIKLQELEDEKEQIELEREKQKSLLIKITNEKQTILEEKKRLSEMNKILSQKLSQTKKISPVEFETLKTTNCSLLKELKEKEKVQKQWEEKNKTFEGKLNFYKNEEKRREVGKKEKEERNETVKEICCVSLKEDLKEFNDRMTKMVKEFNERREQMENESLKTNAMSDMKEIFNLMKTLKIDVNDENDISVLFPVNSDNVQLDENRLNINVILKEMDEVTKSKIWECNKNTTEKFLLQLEEFSKMTRDNENKELNERLNRNACKLLCAKFLSQTEKLSLDKKMVAQRIEQPDYTEKMTKLEELNKVLSESKKKKEISKAISTTNEIRKLIKNDILPRNSTLRNFLKQAQNDVIDDNLLADVDEGSKIVKRLIETAKADLIELEKLSPIDRNNEKELKEKRIKLENEWKEEQTNLIKKWNEIKDEMMDYVQGWNDLSNKKIELSLTENELETIQFKILRWEEAKGDRKVTLNEYIEERINARNYISVLESLLTVGLSCLLSIDEQKRTGFQTSLKKLNQDHSKVFDQLYLSLKTDYENKNKQLARLSDKNKALKEQMDEAVELMDEEAVESLQNQIKDMPKKEKLLLNKIEEIKRELTEMEKLSEIEENSQISPQNVQNEKKLKKDEKKLKKDENSQFLDKKDENSQILEKESLADDIKLTVSNKMIE